MNFFPFLHRSGTISRMVYMDSAFYELCIRNAIGGACDEVWQYAILWFMGLQLRIQDEVLIAKLDLKCEDYVHPSIPIYKYKCTSIIKTKKKKIQNPVDPAGPDCYRIDTKPCESL